MTLVTLYCLAQQLRQNTVQGTASTGRYLIVNEAKDASGKEQLSYIIRYVDKGVINEKPTGAYHMRQVNTAGLTLIHPLSQLLMS
jgi:hypothetical protein